MRQALACDHRRNSFQRNFVRLVKSRRTRAVHIQHADQRLTMKNRHDDFTFRRRITGNMTRKSMNIFDKLCLALGSGCPADTFAERNTQAP